MNGDTQIILNKIIEIETKQDERHRENKEDLKILFKKYDKLDVIISGLSCKVHEERMIWLNRYLKGLCVLIFGVITWLAKIHFIG